MQRLPVPYFPAKPIKLDYIYYHIGRFAVAWADAEYAVDACLETFAMALPDPLYKRPLSTKRRVETFKSQLKKLRITDDQRSDGRSLIERFSNFSEHRHWTIHGVTTGGTFQGETYRHKGGFVSFSRRNQSTGDHEWADYRISDIEIIADNTLALNSQIWDWLTVDLGCSTPAKTKKVARKIGM